MPIDPPLPRGFDFDIAATTDYHRLETIGMLRLRANAKDMSRHIRISSM
jgi:hypothetical protein